ncbi:MAG: flagellar motor protein MotB [Candidatus Omnitrophica bacterium]|nr:flagellar motor protein MotB [Candidatus Omnitrophota bacterium]MBU0897334.1 flagellar motor protein MotB [Candidatus Omnitrophota bacterium]MBU1134082.1 flagellar motor protein MotB [Candidatus Omnitrophota bacterium]MBU1366329.1 flagellar motor protein MotB [Candidatus Omnitrophota bacterium]MBU1524001.1 flagellar motor protein MotB [Candidatus Omnitrophota bacterium]
MTAFTQEYFTPFLLLLGGTVRHVGLLNACLILWLLWLSLKARISLNRSGLRRNDYRDTYLVRGAAFLLLERRKEVVMGMRKLISLFLVCGIFFLSGCAVFRRAEQVDMLELENKELRKQLKQLQKAKDAEVARVVQTQEKELQDLEKAKLVLEEQLKREIGEYKAKLEMTERGLVITFLSEIFFNSGKDIILDTGKEALNKVADVLNGDVPDSFVAVEGHTDNDPIKYSGWKSNWELSAARALAVVHYFIKDCRVKPQRLSAVGYGEYKPVALNDTLANKQLNRRVEIIILPSQIKKIKGK